MKTTGIIDLSESQQADTAAKIKDEMARRHFSRKMLVSKSGLSASTIDKALIGQYSHATLTRIEKILEHSFSSNKKPNGIDRDTNSATANSVAPIHMGGYTREAVNIYTGSFLTIRPSFSNDLSLFTYQTDISWSESKSCLVFEEQNRSDMYCHNGFIQFPVATMFLYLISELERGFHRSIIISVLTAKGGMRGLITAMQHISDLHFVPVSAPIVYRRISSMEDVHFGLIEKGHAKFDEYKSLLDEVISKRHARLIAPPQNT